VANLFQ